jgi:hypothetical protein
MIKPWNNIEFLAGPYRHIGAIPLKGLGRVNEVDTFASGWNPQPDSAINDIAFYGDRMYVAGDFLKIDGTNKYRNLVVYKLPFTPDTVKVTGTTTVCLGQAALYTASTGLAGCYYQWRRNGVNVGSPIDTFSCIPNNGDVISCVSTPPLGTCYTTDSAISNNLIVSVPPLILPYVSLAATATALPGEIATVNATTASTGGGFSLRWYVNGLFSGITIAPVFTFTKGAGTDTVYATIIPTAAYCYDTANSNKVQIGERVSHTSDLMGDNRISVYPNPFENHLSVTGLAIGDRLCIYDLNGKKQFDLDQIGNSEKETTLNLTKLTPGCYFVFVKDKMENTISRTLLLRR